MGMIFDRFDPFEEKYFAFVLGTMLYLLEILRKSLLLPY